MDSHEIPLSHGQKALWFLQRLRPDSAAWNIAAAARIRGRDQGRLDAGRLRRAFERLTERHEALRLSFHETPDGPVQRLREAGGLDFREEEWEEGLLQGEAERPFDLEKDPLLRVRLLRTGEDDILLLVIHHLVADLGSLAVIVRELGPLYEGAFDDPPPVPYSAFVGRERLKERHWEYWRKRLGGELPVCELPADRPRPAVRSFRGGSRTRRIGLELPASRVFPFLVAGLDVLLHRASGQTDLLVGSPTSGRLAPELDGTVGYLVNPVVLRSDLSGSPTFGQLLEQVRGVVLGALRHQEYPFPLLVERLQPERDPARPPVFQVMLAFQRAHLRGTGDLAAFALGIAGAVVRTGPLVLESLPLERRSSQLDLELMAAETSRGLELALTFNADLFEPATAERLLGHLVALLEAAAENPERRIGELPLLGPAERQQLLEWNDTAFPLPDRSVPELFEEQAARSPDAPAVDGMSYRELSERSDEVARSLAGLSPEEPVAVLLERGTGLAVALLGILKAGGVYLPLNPSHPEARRARMLELSGAGRVLDVGAGLAPAREGVNPSPTSRVAGTIESLAYLLFTSGSTGDPKGALVPHRGLLNHLLAKIQDLGLSPADRVGQTAPQSFDIHIWQLLAPLLAGARVEVLPDETVGSPGLLKAEVERRGITVLELVPSLIGPLLDQAGAPSGLRWLISTGEALSPELARRWLSTGVPLVNGYGPTECADRVSHAFLGEIPEHAVHTSIGRPIPNLRPHVLSPDLEPQPIGFPGEICIAGAGVGRGYLDDPAGTAAAFVPDPFEPGGRLYRTGDLGRCRPDGEIEVLGRLDEQVKLRGVRIEPGEIQAALAAHPGVREAVVALRGGRLAAWWTGDPATPATPSELREHLLQRLPLAMVPALFQRLDALPLTPHGKIDRRALPDPAPDAPAGDDSPGDGMEQLLAGIFGAVLGREGIGPQDDFFGLGGHSLLAAQVATRVRQALGIELPLNILFEQPTAAGLARRLRSLTGVPSSSMPCAPREERLPLSFAQQGLWFLHRLAPDSPVYNMPGLVRLPGSLDPAASRAALSAIVARHEALRTTFPTTGGEPYQEIGPAVPIAIPVVDLSALPDADREARRLASEEGRRPFDLARGPLLRALLLRLGPEEQRLLVVLHHIVADGWSLGVLAREMSALLRGEALPELAVQYADYACWQRRWPAEILDRQLAWWTGRLAGLTPLDLPTDRPRPAAQSFRGGLVSAALPALPRDRRATPFLQLLAAWQVLLHRLTGQSDVAVGSPAANRSRPETEGLVGLFANTLVLRTDLSEEPDFAGALAQVREAALLAQAHQDLPFERLVSELAPERDLSRPPLVQMAFSFEEALPPLDLGEGRQGGIEELHPGTSRLDLWLRVEAGEEGWRARAEYAADLFDEATVRRWLGHLQTLLEGIAPDVRISELPLLSPAEIAELTSWNRTAAEIPEEPVHRLFLRQAERAPDALAVEWPGGRLTYGELARRAGRLAGRLSGVGPETVVALRMERSPELIIAALGTLLAGGAYLPIDPTNPEERARWILEDSGALLELTALPENGDMPPPAAFDPDLLAYVIYTSGSTGTPKGTELRHRGLSSLIAWHVRTYGLGPSDRTTLLAGPGFDASVWETWAALTCGASLHVPPPETVLSPAALLAWMAEQRITVSFLPTPLAEAVLAGPFPEGLALRCLLTGGDRLRLRPAPELPFHLFNHYGPTESTVVATAGRVALEGETAPDIGAPIANTRAWVLDRDLRLVPAGVAGELCLAGEGLARAYRGRPGLTAERFVPNPFGEGERLYRTGDLARWLPEGNLQFLGRIDHQVKIRGFRIEPGEIEAVLR
ncbi:MAG: amino acid adenylation domain-containing protein, partial [Thermoanaerobaculia bacterium]